MSRLEDFKRIIRGSMSYEFEGTELTVTNYWTGEQITIDLEELSEDAFEDMVIEDEEV